MQSWIDFVRGLAPGEQGLAMQKHLDQGCPNCRELVEMWKHVLDCAIKEKSQQPPEASVRMAKALFAMSRVQEGNARKICYAELVFDSFRHPLAAEIRSEGGSARQLVFQRRNYCIDVRIEQNGERLTIVGQMLDSGQASMGIGNIPVRLLALKQQTTTNRFGEFQFECEAENAEDLRFLFVMREERDLMISIPAPELSASPA
jgi:hypothetical protein